MTDMALNEQFSATDRVQVVRRFGMRDARFHGLTGLAALLVVAIFGGVIASLIVGSIPAVKAFGFRLLYLRKRRNPVFGEIRRTGLDLRNGCHIRTRDAHRCPGRNRHRFLPDGRDTCPRPLRRPIGIAIELLAGITSIIYGIWGLFVFAPEFQKTLQPWLIDVFGRAPFFQDLFAGPPYDSGTFTAALVRFRS